MRGLTLSLAALSTLLATGGGAGAGVYDSADPPLFPLPSAFDQVRLVLGELRASDDRAATAAAQPAAGSRRAAYLEQVAELEKKERQGTLCPTERSDLGACLIRLGRIDRAVAVLEEARKSIPKDDPARFLVLANLANAYSANADMLVRALDAEKEALAAWPTEWPGWTRDHWLWNRKAEQLDLQFLRLRQQEQVRNLEEQRSTGKAPPVRTVDPLFPKVKWVGPGGKYEPGLLALASWDELPLDAHQLVLQLLLWHPQDSRLYWLYAELLNARGQVEPAFKILDELVYARQWSNVDELVQHRRLLARALPEPSEKAASTDPVALEAPVSPSPALPSPAPPPAAAPGWLPDWRAGLVGFGAGALVMILVMLQWAEWRRRRQVASVPEKQTWGG